MAPSASVTFITINSADDDLQQAENLVKKFDDTVGRVSAALPKINPAVTSAPSPRNWNLEGLAAMECEAVTGVRGQQLQESAPFITSLKK